MARFPEYPKILLWGEHLNVWLAKKQGSFQAKESFPQLILRLAGSFKISMKIHSDFGAQFKKIYVYKKNGISSFWKNFKGWFER